MELLTLVLAAYFSATAISSFDGPFGVFARLQKLGKPFDCSFCMSLYSSALLSVLIAHGLTGWVLLTLAGAGGAVAIDRLVLSKET